jgi:hypothetical protein
VRNDGAAGLTLSRTSATARTYGEGVDSAGQWFLRDQTAAAVRMSIHPTTGAVSVNNQLIVGGAASGAGLTISDGYVDSTEGYFTNFGSFQSIQAPSGGVYARSLRAIAYTQLGNSFGIPTLTAGDGFAAGALNWNTASGALQVYNGFGWVSVGGAAGVTSVSAGSSNVTVSPTSGSVVVNLSSNVTIQNLALTGFANALTLSSGYVQAAGGFVSTSFAFNSIQTTGGIYAQTGYSVGTGTVIDASRNVYVTALKNTGGGDIINNFNQFVGAGVAVQGNAVGCGAVNIWNGGGGYYSGHTATYLVNTFGGGVAFLIFRGGVHTTS